MINQVWMGRKQMHSLCLHVCLCVLHMSMLGDDQKRVLDAPWNGIIDGHEAGVVCARIPALKFPYSAKAKT